MTGLQDRLLPEVERERDYVSGGQSQRVDKVMSGASPGVYPPVVPV